MDAYTLTDAILWGAYIQLELDSKARTIVWHAMLHHWHVVMQETSQ